MSRFDKFPRQPAHPVPVPRQESKSSTEISEQLQRKGYSSADADRIPEQVARVLFPRKGVFVFCLDATGSMAPTLKDAKNSLREIATRMASEAKCAVEIEVIAYRDYDMGNLVREDSGLTADMEKLVKFLDGLGAAGGGADGGEAVQAGLERALQIENLCAVLLAGDEPAHTRLQLNGMQRHQQLTAAELARQFGDKKIPVHTFVVGQRPDTIASFEAIAQASGGKRGFLDGSKAMIDMAVMAMLASLKGAAAVQVYMQKNLLSDNAADFGRLLIEGPKG